VLDRLNEPFQRYPRLAAAALVLVTFAAYGGSLANTFVYDDEYQVLQNPFVVNPHLWRRIFTGSVWSFRGAVTGDNFYRPLQIFCYWLIYRVAGPDPAAFHLAQLLLYSLTVWLVYRLGSRVLQSELAAFAGALLWALHPLHVEAVAWIGGWPEVGFGLFYLLALLLFLRAEGSERGQLAPHGLAALAYLPALFFKEMAVSLPLVILAYWFCPSESTRRPSLRTRAVRLVPYLASVAIYLGIRQRVLGHLVRAQHLWKVSPPVVASSVALLGQHTKLFFWPAHLNAFRNFELGPSLRSPWPWITLATLAAAVLLRKRQPLLSFLVLWWPVTLLPCLDIRQLSNPLLADRFSYIPSVGLCLAVSWVVFLELPRRLPRLRPARLMIPSVSCLAVVAILWAARTAAAAREWRDNETLIHYSLAQSPNAATLHIVQGWILEYRKGDLDGAAREFETALRLNQANLRPMPDVIYDATVGLGQVAYHKGDREEGVRKLRKAIQLMPNETEAYQVLGSMYFPGGDYATAATQFAQAVRCDPQNVAARFMLGTCWIKLGKFREAAEQFQAAAATDPTYRQAYAAEARALEAAGDAAGAAAAKRLASED
jgi:protein O-mannosyl-transferase